MAVIHDVMPAFELFQPATADDALRLLGRYREEAWVMAGGLDSFDWLKDRIKRPKVVVDLSQIQELRGIREAGGGLEIGAMTTLTEVVRHSIVREKYSILSQGAEAAASPQIRNQGTIGGNVSQDTRCWYYRGGWDCYRAGGNTCFADTPTGINREHAILGADRCVARQCLRFVARVDRLGCQIYCAHSERRAGGERGRLLHRARHGYHPDERLAAWGSSDGHSLARGLGWDSILL